MLRTHGRTEHAVGPLAWQAQAVLRDAKRCRTAALGGHLERCGDCGHERPAYNSCRNRHCPTCQGARQLAWVTERAEAVLPVRHFHVVFTLPKQLRPIARANPGWTYKTLFDCARQTLMTLGRQRLGNADQAPVLGVTAVLHTWSRDLHLHPHLHCVVTAGGWDPKTESWVAVDGDYLLPVFVMADLFRGLLLGRLRRAQSEGRIALVGRAQHLARPGAFRRLLEAMYRKRWVVYAKLPFAGPQQVFRYLGRYTHRVAVSDRRLLAVSDDAVVLRTRGDSVATMTPEQFVTRFLLHVLPKGFHKIRHFGLYAPSWSSKRRALQVSLAVPTSPGGSEGCTSLPAPPVPAERSCTLCGGGVQRWALPSVRGPPERPC